MRKLLLAFIAVMLAGCVTGQSVRQLSPGMSRAEVIEIMGAPDGVQTNGSSEVLKYANRLMSGFSWDKTDYFVTLQDGRVTQYGNGEVRQSAPPQFNIPQSTYAPAAPMAPIRTTCMKSSESTTGMTKQCVYNCMGSPVVQTQSSVSLCPLTIER